MRGLVLGLGVLVGACATAPQNELARRTERAAIGQTALPIYTWTQRFTWPFQYAPGMMAYDAARERTFFLCLHSDFLSGSALADTWEWSGDVAKWSPLATGAEVLRNPDKHFSTGGALAYDSKRKLTVIQDVVNGFWEWDGVAATWTLRPVADADRHTAFGLIYDADREVFVYVGERDTTTDAVGVWEWDPVTGDTTERAPTGTQPTPRWVSNVVWDTGRKKLLLFSGYPYESGKTLADIWEWDPGDGTWEDRTPSGTKPDSRQTYASAYDEKLGHAFFFGGTDPVYDAANPDALMNDLWEWDGDAGQWIAHTLAPGSAVPDGGYQYDLVYDSKREVLELFGGNISETTEGRGGQDAFDWDQASESWLDRRPPTGREAPAFAYDPKTEREILFGGEASDAGSLNDLWAYDGASDAWQRLDVSDPVPNPRYYAAFVADEQRERLLLVGGSNVGSALMPGLWELEPTADAWVDRASSTGPATGYATMSYDPTRGKMLFFGGYSGNGQASDKFWEWDGAAGTWTDRTGSDPRPGARMNVLSAFDVTRNRLVLFGGGDPQGQTTLDDTWEWNPDDGTWTERLPPGTFSTQQVELGMYYDDVRQRVVLVGGDPPGFSSGEGLLNTVWEWDGDVGNWAEIPIAGAAPETRYGPGLTYDRTRRAFVLFSGNKSGRLRDQWELTVACPDGTDPCPTTASPPPVGASGAGGTSGRAGATGTGGASGSAGSGTGASAGRGGTGGTTASSGGKAGRGGSLSTGGTDEQMGGTGASDGSEDVTPKSSQKSDSGCGCRVGQRGPGSTEWLLAVALGAGLVRRRRRLEP